MKEWLRAPFVPTRERRAEAIGRAPAAYERVIALGPAAPTLASLGRTGDLYFDLAAHEDVSGRHAPRRPTLFLDDTGGW